MTDFDIPLEDCTVGEAKDEIESASLDTDGIKAAIDYETAHDDRVTLLRWLNDQLGEAEEVEQPDTIFVRRIDGGGHAVGEWFEHAHDVKEVENNARVQQSIERDILEQVQPRD